MASEEGHIREYIALYGELEAKLPKERRDLVDAFWTKKAREFFPEESSPEEIAETVIRLKLAHILGLFTTPELDGGILEITVDGKSWLKRFPPDKDAAQRRVKRRLRRGHD